MFSIFLLLAMPPSPLAVRGDIALPADKLDSDVRVTIVNPRAERAHFDFANPELDDQKGEPIRDVWVETDPRSVNLAGYASLPVTLHFFNVRFFGAATLQLNSRPPGAWAASVRVFRGLKVSASLLEFHKGRPSAIEIENQSLGTLRGHWMVSSGMAQACANTDCASLANWFPFETGPSRQAVLKFTPPDRWFETAASTRQIQLLVNYGQDRNTIEQTVPFTASFVPLGPWREVGHAVSAAVFALAPLGRLVRVVCWLTLGAVAFWFSSVLVGNFGLIAALTKRVRALQERAEAISSTSAGSRSRANLSEMSEALAERAKENSILPNYRQTAEVTNERLAAFERRIQLFEKLDAASFQWQLQLSTGEWPMTVVRNVQNSFENAQRLVVGDVSKEDLNRADQLIASALALDEALQELPAKFKDRLRQVQADLQRAPWSDVLWQFQTAFPSALSLAEIDLLNPEEAALLEADLIERDFDLTQLELLRDLISAGLPMPPETLKQILAHARLRSRTSLNRARSLLRQSQEGISEADFLLALKNGQWDPYFEPNPVTLGSTLRLFIKFHRDVLNQCAARDSFRCYWTFSEPKDSTEEGWEAYWFVQAIDDGTVTVSFLHCDPVNPEEIERIWDPEKKKVRDIEPIPIRAQWPKRKRRFGGELIQLALTLIVPVVTVAFVEFQKNTELSILQLLTVGFTAQVIRTAITPKEDVASAAKTE